MRLPRSVARTPRAATPSLPGSRNPPREVPSRQARDVHGNDLRHGAPHHEQGLAVGAAEGHVGAGGEGADLIALGIADGAGVVVDVAGTVDRDSVASEGE